MRIALCIDCNKVIRPTILNICDSCKKIRAKKVKALNKKSPELVLFEKIKKECATKKNKWGKFIKFDSNWSKENGFKYFCNWLRKNNWTEGKRIKRINPNCGYLSSNCVVVDKQIGRGRPRKNKVEPKIEVKKSIISEKYKKN